MNKFWVLLLALLVSTGCNRSSTPSIAKPSAGHAASGASLSAQDTSWETRGHLLNVSGKQRTAHPVYPFSLVAGGVYSPAELQRALATSDSLRAHYKNFDFKHVRLIRIQNNTPAFVSYRKNGKIFWTKRKLTVQAGELVLADGHYLVRARCANQISFVPQDPVDVTASDVEGQLDIPSVPAQMDYPRLREVSSPLLPPMEFAPQTTVLAKAYMPAATLPVLRFTPVCKQCGESSASRPTINSSTPPHQAVPMPDGDGFTLLVVALLLIASLFILKTQKRV